MARARLRTCLTTLPSERASPDWLCRSEEVCCRVLFESIATMLDVVFALALDLQLPTRFAIASHSLGRDGSWQRGGHHPKHSVRGAPPHCINRVTTEKAFARG